MSWIPIDKKAYDRDRKKSTTRKDQRVTQTKIKLPTDQQSDKVRWVLHCPRLCQQKENGSKGKKTFDGNICKSCGYVKNG